MRTYAKAPIDWLIPRARKKVLALLLGAPDRRWHLREIARRTGCAVGTVRRELSGLVQAEFLTCARDGNRTYYQANPSSPLFPELSGMIRKTAGLADVIREGLSALADRIRAAFIYGSQARGMSRAASDVDLLVVGDVDETKLHMAVREVEKALDRPVNYTLLDTREFRRRSKDKSGFLGRILAGPKIPVIGGADEV